MDSVTNGKDEKRKGPDEERAMLEFLQADWFWIVLILFFIGIHSFGGGCCGGEHQSRKKRGSDEAGGVSNFQRAACWVVNAKN